MTQLNSRVTIVMIPRSIAPFISFNYFINLFKSKIGQRREDTFFPNSIFNLTAATKLTQSYLSFNYLFFSLLL